MNNALHKMDEQYNDFLQFCIKDKILNPKVSIIIPVYNTEKYLFKCLNSLLKQTLKEIEIIIVNDGSTDGSGAIIEMFAQSDTRFKVINQNNLRQGAARNNGTKIATGEYIGFVDSDDYIDLDYYEKLYNAAKKYNSDIALATNIRIGNGETKKRLNIKEEIFVTEIQDKYDINHQPKNPCPTNKIYKKELLDKNNIIWPEGVYYEDKIFTLKAVYYANGVVSVPNINYYYFRNKNSTVLSTLRKHKKNLIDDKNNANLEVLNFLKENNVNIRDKDFWAITNEYKIFNITVIRVKESLKTSKYYLFGIIKIWTNKINPKTV